MGESDPGLGGELDAGGVREKRGREQKEEKQHLILLTLKWMCFMHVCTVLLCTFIHGV